LEHCLTEKKKSVNYRFPLDQGTDRWTHFGTKEPDADEVTSVARESFRGVSVQYSQTLDEPEHVRYLCSLAAVSHLLSGETEWAEPVFLNRWVVNPSGLDLTAYPVSSYSL